MRSRMPRFTEENRAKNRELVKALQAVAAEKGVTASQLAVAWVLAKGRNLIPTLGARTRAQLDESLGALAITLSDTDLVRIENAVPAAQVAGSRYDERQMRMLDSELS